MQLVWWWQYWWNAMDRRWPEQFYLVLQPLSLSRRLHGFPRTGTLLFMPDCYPCPAPSTLLQIHPGRKVDSKQVNLFSTSRLGASGTASFKVALVIWGAQIVLCGGTNHAPSQSKSLEWAWGNAFYSLLWHKAKTPRYTAQNAFDIPFNSQGQVILSAQTAESLWLL